MIPTFVSAQPCTCDESEKEKNGDGSETNLMKNFQPRNEFGPSCREVRARQFQQGSL